MRWSNNRRREDDTPSYLVEHLATFGVGPQFGLQWPNDGIRKLKQMERSSAIWAQRMVLKLRREAIVVEDENGEIVEQFPLHLVAEPTAHLSNDPRDVYNNLLVFIVNEDRQKRSATPTEMHIFQCKLVSANEVADDIRLYLNGRFTQVPPGLRDTGFDAPYPPPNGRVVEPEPSAYPIPQSRSFEDSPIHQHRQQQQQQYQDRHVNQRTNATNFNVQTSRDDYATSDYFERDVNTLNRCFDDIERFVGRIQTCALAQRDLEQIMHRRGGKNRSNKPHQDESMLRARAQLPIEPEFVGVFQKFKLCFNLLAKLKNHIHEPNAPELLHFLFTPLTVILDACQWGTGRPVAPNVIMPLITREAKELMLNCLTSKESEVWMSLGDAWRVPIEDWPHPLPTNYTPTFESMGPSPYRNTPPVDNGRIDMEKQRLDLERERLAMKEEALRERERIIQEEKRSLHELKRRFDEEKRSVASDHPPHLEDDYPMRLPTSRSTNDIYRDMQRGVERNVPVLLASGTSESARQRVFLEDLRARRCKIVQATYDRVGQNPKELTVLKGEYLEVLNDTKKWWECRNMNNRIGYVPNTIVTVIDIGSPSDLHHHNGGARAVDEQIFVRPSGGGGNGANSGPPSSSFYVQQERGGSQIRGGSASPRGGNYGPRPDTPDYLRNRIGPPPTHIYQQAYTQYIPPPSPPLVNTGVQTDDRPHHHHHHQQQQQQPLQQQQSVPPPPPPPINALLTNANTNNGYSRNKPINGQMDGPTVIKVGNGDVSNSRYGSKASDMQISALVREKSVADQLRDEITSTLGKKKTSEILIKKPGNGMDALGLTVRSSEQEVAEWLEAKGFSIRTQKLLEGQTGATLFSLSKKQLQDFCGKDEGQRLYSQLLVQKNTSGYKTNSDAELRAILANRKGKAEQPQKENGQVKQNDQPSTSQLDGIFTLTIHE